MFDKLLGIAYPPEDEASIVRSDIRICESHLNYIRKDPVGYMDRYGRLYIDPKAAIPVLDRSFNSRIKQLEIKLARITSLVEHSPVPSTSGFHISDIWSYFKTFFVNRFSFNVHPVSAADKIDIHEGKGDAQGQPAVDQEFKSYSGEKHKGSYDEKGEI